MFIQTEQTPNPQSLKFLPGKVVMSDGTIFFKNLNEAQESPFAQKLFKIEGVVGVFFGSDFITITKKENLDWQVMKPEILGKITEHFNSGDPTLFNMSDKNKKDISMKDADNSNDSEIVKQIKELLDTRVRPAVAMDGGDIIYESYDDGIVYLHMQGSCSGCPSSTATLKNGIENMLKHYVPEVKEVRPVDA